MREFSITLTFAIIISTIVSLTVTPMICARLPRAERKEPSCLDRAIEGASTVIRLYARSLRPVVDHQFATLVVIVVTMALTVHMYNTIPKGRLPQDDIGLINGTTEASADVSFAEMVRLQKQAVEVLAADPDVANTGSFIGAKTFTPATNQGRLFVALKPASERRSTSMQVIARLRPEFAKIAGLRVFMVPSQDLRSGGRQSKAQFQFTLSDASLDALEEWTPRVLERMRRLPELADVSTDRQADGLKADVVIDRTAAARMGVTIAAIDAALNSSFGQRQLAIIYTQRNQYRVIFEAPLSRQRDPRELSGIYVSSANGSQIPLTAVAHIEQSAAPPRWSSTIKASCRR